MRAFALAAALLASSLPLGSAALAQANKGAAKPAPATGQTTRFTMISGELIADLASDTIWRETRQGGKTVSAEIDVCYSPSPLSNAKERFVVPLRLENGKLVGSGQIEPTHTPVKISLARTQSGETFALEGTITRGSKVDEVAASELTDMGETEFREEQARADEIVADPKDFREVSPVALGVRVSVGKVAEVVKSLRGQNVDVDYASLVATCADLRAGDQLVRIGADPERAPALVKQLKAQPGATAAGWTPGVYGIESAVRFAAAPWRNGTALKKDELAARISGTIAKSLQATAVPPEWDAVTREMTLRFKRPDPAVPGLDLTEVIEIVALVSPEKPEGGDQLVLWITDPTLESVDEGTGPRVSLTGTSHASDEEGATVDLEGVLAALAKELNGQRWDPEESAWK